MFTKQQCTRCIYLNDNILIGINDVIINIDEIIYCYDWSNYF